jgi:hypothetical protein
VPLVQPRAPAAGRGGMNTGPKKQTN